MKIRPKPFAQKAPAKRVLAAIRRATHNHYSAEDKRRVVLDGLRGDDSIVDLCRREGIAQPLYYVWPKESLKLASAAWLAIRHASDLELIIILVF